MKMNFKYASMMACAALLAGFTSCSNDDAEVPGVNPIEGADAKMGLSIKLPQGLTRADGDATAEESAIASIHVYVFNNDGTSATKGGYTGLTVDGTNFDVNNGVYTLKNEKAIETVTGGKRVYVGANLPTAFHSFTNESQLFSAAKTIEAAMYANGTFAMFSTAVSTPSLEATADKENIPAANKVTVELERMMAKFTAKKAPGFVETSKPSSLGADGATIAWTIGEYVIMQDATQTFTAQQAGVFTTPGVVRSFSDAIAFANQGTAWYIGENAPSPKEAGKSTYALIRAKATIDKTAKMNAAGDDIEWTSGAVAAGQDFWLVQVQGDKTEQYLCSDKDEANAIALFKNASLADGADKFAIYTYAGGYVYFRVWLNNASTLAVADRLNIKRNQQIDMLITGVSADAFGGFPGDKDDPTKPIDPNKPGEDGENPDPTDPTDPIVEEDTYLLVEVSVKNWDYYKENIVLE